MKKQRKHKERNEPAIFQNEKGDLMTIHFFKTHNLIMSYGTPNNVSSEKDMKQWMEVLCGRGGFKLIEKSNFS